MDVKQLNKIMKLYYIYTLKALWDGQGKIKMHYGMSRVKKQLLGKRSIRHALEVERYSLLTKSKNTYPYQNTNLLEI